MKGEKSMRNSLHYRQGDVGISKVSTSDFTLVPVKPVNNRAILAYGEATGHHHSVNLLDYPNVELFTAKEQPQTMILRITDEPAIIEHQEHGHITLDPGWYQVERQVEYDPETTERRVAD
jgi:hypothetical protein